MERAGKGEHARVNSRRIVLSNLILQRGTTWQQRPYHMLTDERKSVGCKRRLPAQCTAHQRPEAKLDLFA